MRKHSIAFSIVILFAVMLRFPRAVFQGATEGLMLWFQTILPTLLPFIIVSNLLIHTNAISYISNILGPIIKYFFGISKRGSFAVVVGFLCGYPMGAKVTADLIRADHISAAEGQYLLSFCNNTSPIFVMSYIVIQSLQNEALLIPVMVILFGSPILSSFLFRLYYRKQLQLTASDCVCTKDKPVSFEFAVVDRCIMNSFETITQVGGYIILFSVLLTLIKLIPVDLLLWHELMIPSLELTNGIPMILREVGHTSKALLYVLALSSFGGVCAIAQTQCMIQGTALKIRPYIIQKLITALVTSLLTIIYLTA